LLLDITIVVSLLTHSTHYHKKPVQMFLLIGQRFLLNFASASKSLWATDNVLDGLMAHEPLV